MWSSIVTEGAVGVSGRADLNDYFNVRERLTGFFVPPVSGNYRFTISGDDVSGVWRLEWGLPMATFACGVWFLPGTASSGSELLGRAACVLCACRRPGRQSYACLLSARARVCVYVCVCVCVGCPLPHRAVRVAQRQPGQRNTGCQGSLVEHFYPAV